MGGDEDTIKEYDIAANGVSLHVTEQGAGPVVLFCHGLPDTSYTWRQQMKSVACAGYRAIAPDMRGYGSGSAPADPAESTPLHRAGDLVGLPDALQIASAVIVGHDWGATHAWAAALMRPDRFPAACCLSVPYVPRGNVSVCDRMRADLPGLVGAIELDNVGHWIQHEAAAAVSDQFVKFLRSASPA